MDNLENKRLEYGKDVIRKEDLAHDPMAQFDRWYQDAERAKISEPNAMTLASVSADGKPSARIVLLKGFNQRGFSFYTNYESRKSKEIIKNPMVSAVFWWKELVRQVRIEGIAEKLDFDTSLSYFHSRPRGSQISAWASPQSEIIDFEQMLDKREEIEKKFEGQDSLPLPEFWGGFLIQASSIEFWQGRENRFHDRFRYRLADDGHWTLDRLAP